MIEYDLVVADAINREELLTALIGVCEFSSDSGTLVTKGIRETFIDWESLLGKTLSTDILGKPCTAHVTFSLFYDAYVEDTMVGVLDALCVSNHLILAKSNDLALFYTADIPVLVRKDGQVSLNSDRVWTRVMLERLNFPYTFQPIPYPPSPSVEE